MTKGHCTLSLKFPHAFFRIHLPFLSKCMLRMQKRRKSNLIRIVFDGRKFRRQCTNVTDTTLGRIYFLTCENFGLSVQWPLRPLSHWVRNFRMRFSVFSYSSSFPIKMHATDAKTQKIEPDPIFFDERKFRSQCANVIGTTWGRIYFLTCENFGRNFRTQCAETFTITL